MADETKPAVDAGWALTAVPPDVESAPSGKIDTGWIAGEAPPHDWFNFLLKNDADWIRYLAAQALALVFFNWEQAVGTDTDGEFEESLGGTGIDIRGGDYDVNSGLWVVAGNTDGCNISKDDGRNFEPFGTGMASAVGLQDIAVGGSSSAVAVGSSATMYQRASLVSGSWGTVTAPGSPVALSSIVYDDFNDRHVVVGEEAAVEPYVATADDATGTAFTDRSAALPAGFDALGLESLAVNKSGVVVACPRLAHTKLARSGDGGVTWVESTSTLVSARYHVTWNQDLDLFFAIRTDSDASHQTYSSPDGLTWTSTFAGAIGFTSSTGRGEGHRLTSFGHAIVYSGFIAPSSALAFSFDGGASWQVQRISIGSDAQGRLVTSRQQGKMFAFTGNAGSRSPRRRLG